MPVAAGLQPPLSPGGRHNTSSINTSASGGAPPVSPRFSPPLHRPPISPGGTRSHHSSATNLGLQMPPLSPGGRSSAGNKASMSGGSSLRAEALNRAHRRVLSGGALNLLSGSAGIGGGGGVYGSSGGGSGGSGGGASHLRVRGLSVPRNTHSAYRNQHLSMRVSSSVDEYDSSSGSGSSSTGGIGAFPSSPHRAGHPPHQSSRHFSGGSNRLRSVSYDEADRLTSSSASSSMPHDELDSIRLELQSRREKQALLDQRRRELEEIMSSTPPTRRVVTTTRVGVGGGSTSEGGGQDNGEDDVSPLKTSDSPGKNKRIQQKKLLQQEQQQREKMQAGDASATPVAASGSGGVDDKPAVVSPSSPSRGAGVAKGEQRPSPSGGGSGGGGRRGRSLTPRDRSSAAITRGDRGDGGGLDDQTEHHPPRQQQQRRKFPSHSPAPQNVGVRRLGRAVDAVLARRKRRGSISTNTKDASGNALDPSETYQQSLTDEEKHVLAKIIVAVDTKLEHELDLVKNDLQGKTKIEASIREELEKEKKMVGRLERELEQAREGAEAAVTVRQNEASQKAMNERIAELEKENEMSLRAIQRVLADVTTDKDNKIEELEQKMKKLVTENETLREKKLGDSSTQDGGDATGSTAAADTSGSSGLNDKVLKERNEVIQSLEKKVEILTKDKEELEKELSTAKTIAAASISSKESEVSKRDEAIKTLEEKLTATNAEKDVLQAKVEDEARSASSSSSDSVEALPRGVKQDDLEQLRTENDKLKKDLQSKISSLETAKMMITSLETASGCQANDLRAKLKERNEELAALKVRADNSDSELATLKSELIHMQKKYVDADKAAREAKAMLNKQRSVHRQLKAEITKISSQSNVVQCNEEGEVEVEVTIGGEVTSVVQKSLSILAEGDKSSSEEPPEEDREADGEMDTLRRKVEGLTEEKDAAVVRLNEELVLKNVALNNMEDQLKLQKEEYDRLRLDLEKAREEFQQNLSESQFEIQRLTDDYTIANEQLAKKEKELSVLKESLNEPSTGYISDDDDFDDEDEGTGAAGGGAFSDAAARQANISAEAENLELLLLSQGNAAGSAVAATYFERLKALESDVAGFRKEKESAAKQIKEKEEALANAKMIISSLEKSNKSMLEDLRNRLHDSNTAIVSLLSKNQNLEGEMKELRKSKEEEANKLKEEALESADKLADLRERVDNYERIARRMGVDDTSSMVSSLGATSSDYESDMMSDELDDLTTDEEGRFPGTMSPNRTPRDGEEEV